ncbi:putative metal-dependent peptidase [Spirosoma oryzae]|uniref:Putative metal-dependent peptidase n=1 Tax=Spirosoma oryzae TaxID=1469603 RepID=A0A2T0SYM2_9BACT|nr:VWA-like domain-containing protein [Spirosoma oryzae]PRY38505.1 putative metal-dependent peptidase [Spirosoma oryzae]
MIKYTDKKAYDKLIGQRIQLLFHQPFFAQVCMYLTLIEDPAIPTACTNGKYIKYNPTWINGMTKEAAQGLILHEVGHVILLHQFRKQGREHHRWNIACDHFINLWLLDAGFKLPEGGYHDEQYKGMSSEKIYDLLRDDPNMPKYMEIQLAGGIGDVEQATQEVDGKSVSEQENEIKEIIRQAAVSAKKAGKLPGSLARLIDETLEPQVDWRNELAAFVSIADKADYCFTRPSRRYSGGSVVMPSLYSQTIGQIYLFVDTSGSIGARELNVFGAELRGIAGQFGKPIEVLYVDHHLAGMQTVEPDETADLVPVGGGGTSFEPPFSYLRDEGIQPACAVYFTDGICDDYPDFDPTEQYPVLWVILGDNKNFSPPFGRVLHIAEL